MVSEAHASRSADQLDKRRQSARPWSDPARPIRSARAMSEMRSAERSSHLDDDRNPWGAFNLGGARCMGTDLGRSSGAQQRSRVKEDVRWDETDASADDAPPQSEEPRCG